MPWGDTTPQAPSEWKTQQGPIQAGVVYLVMCDPILQFCIYQLTTNQTGTGWLICCLKLVFLRQTLK